MRPERASDVEDDEPVTLAEACRLFFGGRLSPSALRTEAAKGNLDIIQIARKDFVTRRAIEEMKERCRVSRARPASGSDRTPPPGSSRTERGVSAQDAVRMMLKQRKERSETTSTADKKPRTAVVPPKSR
ncbi:hypothetical protein NA8A_23013 [Nitratireductor indicus C115]|uniref:Uncharacterized protein n=1 Tax=Nitratireductor indicus C115 TaxID=1231190 RepID=K2NKS2_9HYPH|nr:hypothetical protein [Nitratireductor indicus]EKF40020.1 hypothetical protein NA8A_23013 [Nitratireductor indicus C115]SFQ79985.1 hypothetical protein SAMN05216176_11749 [Nitratireductor indicus]